MYRGLGSISDTLAAAAAKWGVPLNLLTAVAQRESSLNPYAVSSAGAKGVMQLMPATAAQYGVSNPFDPDQSIDAGAHLLSDLLRRYNGDTSLALAAYNAGPGNVAKYGGIPPFAETQNYVSGILSSIDQPSTWQGPVFTPDPAAFSFGHPDVWDAGAEDSGLSGGAWAALAAVAVAAVFLAA